MASDTTAHSPRPAQSSPSPEVSRRSDDPAPLLAREGWAIIAIAAAVAVLLGGLGMLLGPAGAAGGGAVGLALVGFCCWFFRDPPRSIPDAPGVVVAPADGQVIGVDQVPPPDELGLGSAPMTRVVIFLNVFNVHVNRTPLAGKVLKVARKSGGFAHAGKPEAMHNERCSLAMDCAGRTLVVSQVTGLIARRIINRAREGQALRTGERFGLIRFGSRTDLYLPLGTKVEVAPGQHTIGAHTIIARL